MMKIGRMQTVRETKIAKMLLAVDAGMPSIHSSSCKLRKENSVKLRKASMKRRSEPLAKRYDYIEFLGPAIYFGRTLDSHIVAKRRNTLPNCMRQLKIKSCAFTMNRIVSKPAF